MALWIKKKNNWNEALQRDYFSPRTLKAESIPNGIVLPPKGDAGGVCDSQNKWVAGLTRTTENASFKPGWFGYLKAYSVKKEELIQREESVVFGGILVDHFGHCLIDSLNRSWWFLQNPNDSRKIVFVVATPWGLRGGGGRTALSLNF